MHEVVPEQLIEIQLLEAKLSRRNAPTWTRTPSKILDKTPMATNSGADSGALTAEIVGLADDSALVRVVSAWPTLSRQVKAAIFDLVSASMHDTEMDRHIG
jgi:hypothetical protein